MLIEACCSTKEFKVRVLSADGGMGSFSLKYHVSKVVDEVSFEVAEGEIIGYVGPNGAGKSTTIEMMAGLLVPTRGSVPACGLDPTKQKKLLAKISCVFGQRTQLWWDPTLKVSLELLSPTVAVGVFATGNELVSQEPDAVAATPTNLLPLPADKRCQACGASVLNN